MRPDKSGSRKNDDIITPLIKHASGNFLDGVATKVQSASTTTPVFLAGALLCPSTFVLATVWHLLLTTTAFTARRHDASSRMGRPLATSLAVSPSAGEPTKP